MKKIIFLFFGILLTACEKADWLEIETIAEQTKMCKKFTFTIKGDFESPTFTRAYLTANGTEMTDLWVYDFVDGICVQSVHQQQGDDDWGTPKMPLAYGTHHVYFVASCGEGSVVNSSEHTIVWDKVRDTFWKDYSLTVTGSSNGNRAVTLDRVATRLKMTVKDKVPEGIETLTVTPETWYYGINYVTGEAVYSRNDERAIALPETLAGTTGQLILSIYGLSGSNEWTTNVHIVAKRSDESIAGQAVITGAPFVRNRATEYSGSLFGGGTGAMAISLNDGWQQPIVGEW